MKEVERVGYSHDAATKYSTARTYGNLHSRVRTASQFHHSRVFLYCPNSQFEPPQGLPLLNGHTIWGEVGWVGVGQHIQYMVKIQ